MIGLSPFRFSPSDANLSEHFDGDSSCLNKSPPVMSMEKTKDDLDLEDFEESPRMKFEAASILAYMLKRLRFELEGI